VDTNKLIVGIVLLGSSLLLANLLLKESTKKERIVAGALIGAANGAYIGGAIALPGGSVAGAAVGAALGGLAGDRYESDHKHHHHEK
jgi:outer membrane lipoprotein SlyB